MIAKQLLAKLNESGVKLTIDNGRLSYRESDSRLTPKLKQQIRSMNDDLIVLLGDSDQVGQNEVELTEDRLQTLRSYWKSALPVDLEPIDLPFDHARTSVRNTNGGTVDLQMKVDLAEALRARAREEDCTLLIALMAALKTLLHRYSQHENIIVGTPVQCGGDTQSAVETGGRTNMLPIGTSFAGEPTFRDILRRERDTFQQALQHKDLPFRKIVEAIQPRSEAGCHPIFQIALMLQSTINSGRSDTQNADAPDNNISKFDLALKLTESESGLSAAMEFDKNLFDEMTIDRFLQNFETLIGDAIVKPDASIHELCILPEQRRDLILHQWNDTDRDYPADVTLMKMFEAQVDRTPDAPALIFGETELTYAEFDRRSNQLARYLVERGVGPEMPVGLFLERSTEMLVGIYGILKAGGAYMPLDPDLPSERISFMLEESEVSIVLSQAHLLAKLPAELPEVVSLDSDWDRISTESHDRLPLRAGPDNLAYVIYTSGSTGRPKGVMVEHRAICNREHWVLEEYGFRSDDVVIQKFPFGFDASVCELFTPLLCGARLVIATPGGHRDSQYLTQQIIKHGITTIQIVPSMLDLLIDDGSIDQCKTLRRVLCGGEALTHALHKRLSRHLPNCQLHNMYGPTEAAINVTSWACQKNGQHRTIPIGLPVTNTQIYILDKNLQPVPIGACGELYIGGAQLARGYLNRPDLTRERFIPSPFIVDTAGEQSNAVLYKTGDLCRYFPDGSIEYVSRVDLQVKIRGFRIELGEIEAAIAECATPPMPAVVNPWSPSPSDVRLVAYIEVKGSGGPNVSQLQEQLRNRLPEYMIPQHFVELEELPKTTGGKVDRKLLPPPEIEGTGDPAKPKTAVEQEMAKLWQRRLGVGRIGRSDSFFDLGGHSLSAVQLSADIRRAFKIDFPTRSLIEKPQLDAVSRQVEQILTSGGHANENTAQSYLDAESHAPTVTPSDASLEDPAPRRLASPRRRENWWTGAKNRVLQIAALYAPGLTTLRVKMHRARGVRLGQNVAIGVGALIETSYPHLVEVGNNVNIGIRAVFIGHFGEMTSADATTEPTIRIEDDVFIGPGAIILPQVTIGRGSVITAGSVVNTSVPPKTVMQGNPAIPVARCNAPLAWNNYADYMKNLEPLDSDQPAATPVDAEAPPTIRESGSPSQNCPDHAIHTVTS